MSRHNLLSEVIMAGTLTFREAVSRFVNVFAEVMNAIAKKNNCEEHKRCY